MKRGRLQRICRRPLFVTHKKRKQIKRICFLFCRIIIKIIFRLALRNIPSRPAEYFELFFIVRIKRNSRYGFLVNLDLAV